MWRRNKKYVGKKTNTDRDFPFSPNPSLFDPWFEFGNFYLFGWNFSMFFLNLSISLCLKWLFYAAYVATTRGKKVEDLFVEIIIVYMVFFFFCMLLGMHESLRDGNGKGEENYI